MKPGTTFKELAKLQAEQLVKQPPFSLEQMRDSIRKVQEAKARNKKQKSSATMRRAMTLKETAKLGAELLAKQHPTASKEKSA